MDLQKTLSVIWSQVALGILSRDCQERINRIARICSVERHQCRYEIFKGRVSLENFAVVALLKQIALCLDKRSCSKCLNDAQGLWFEVECLIRSLNLGS